MTLSYLLQPFLQAGGHGTCLAQCRQAHLVTTRTIPMQVDGEPCKLLPSVIDMKLRNQANMMAKATKRRGPEPLAPTMEKLMLEVRRLNMADYENYHYDKEKLRELSNGLCQLCVSQDTCLEAVRGEINKLMDVEILPPDIETVTTTISAQKLSPDWCFLDCKLPFIHVLNSDNSLKNLIPC